MKLQKFLHCTHWIVNPEKLSTSDTAAYTSFKNFIHLFNIEKRESWNICNIDNVFLSNTRQRTYLRKSFCVAYISGVNQVALGYKSGCIFFKYHVWELFMIKNCITSIFMFFVLLTAFIFIWFSILFKRMSRFYMKNWYLKKKIGKFWKNNFFFQKYDL
jgi:hypothetical protein